MERSLESTLLHTIHTRLVHDFSLQIRECLQTLSDAHVWSRPNENANSVGNLVLHLCGSTRYYIVNCIGEVDSQRDRPKEFSERTQIPRDQLIALLESTIADCDRVLSALKPEQMMQTTERTGKTSTYAQILLHVLGHFSAHTGQILYITKMLEEGAINELWRKFR
jgi:uncharacterized damage-inducible protein DinB